MAKLPHSTTTTSPVAYHDGPPDRQPPRRAARSALPEPPHQHQDLRESTVWQMAHELRDPLTSMMGFAQLLLDPKSSPQLDQQQRRCVDHILASGHHLIAVINDMLEVAAMRAGHMALMPEPLNPRTLLTEVRDQLAPQAMAKSQRVTLRTPKALAPVKADHTQMRRVLLNLLSNAIKFAPSTSEIILGAQPVEEGGTDFFVRNQGPIIPRAAQQKIFEPFARMPTTTSEDPTARGTGLGLTFARDLVLAHGGTIWVRSNQRQGTTFWVRLPG